MPSSYFDALCQYVPAIESLKNYSYKSLRKDFFAGLTVAAVAVPQAMAYALIFNLPVEMGLYTAIIMTAVGALLDSSKQLINGPTNVISIAMLSALTLAFGEYSNLPIERQQEWQNAAVMMALMIGAIQTGIALFRFGDLSRFISHSVIIGFTIGASILLLLDQMKSVCGLKSVGDVHDHFFVRFYRTMTEGGAFIGRRSGLRSLPWQPFWSLTPSIKKLKWSLPALLMALVASGTLLWLVDPKRELGVRLLDPVPRTLPSFEIPTVDWNLLRTLSSSALAIAFLGLLEAMAMAKAIASKTGQTLDMNQQCLSEGVANLAVVSFDAFLVLGP